MLNSGFHPVMVGQHSWFSNGDKMYSFHGCGQIDYNYPVQALQFYAENGNAFNSGYIRIYGAKT